ncbi:1349_t:CDS:2, partial [Entrophospora sp. SA101]
VLSGKFLDTEISNVNNKLNSILENNKNLTLGDDNNWQQLEPQQLFRATIKSLYINLYLDEYEYARDMVFMQLFGDYIDPVMQTPPQ